MIESNIFKKQKEESAHKHRMHTMCMVVISSGLHIVNILLYLKQKNEYKKKKFMVSVHFVYFQFTEKSRDFTIWDLKTVLNNQKRKHCI